MINNLNYKKGFTLLELALVLGIIAILLVVLFTTFASFGKQQGLVKDNALIIEVLRQAQSNTLNSKNSNQFGVHFGSTSIVLFTGSTYSAGASTNETYNLSGGVNISNISLNGGGSDLVFSKLSGGTENNGTITITEQSTGQNRSVIIYKTGLIE